MNLVKIFLTKKGKLIAQGLTSLFLLTVYPVSVFAQSGTCADYPLSSGSSFEPVDGGIKILSTYEVSVPLDDVDLVIDAREEATMEAKAAIAAFMSEEIAKACDQTTQTMTSIKISGDQKNVDMTKVKEKICSLSSNTQALLRGVVQLGDCYTPGKTLRITVGIKPETIAGAEALAKNITDSVNRQATPTSENTGNSSTSSGTSSGTGTGLNNVEGFSNTKKLKDF